MKVIVRDFDALNSIKPKQIATYLQAKNWIHNRNFSNKAYVFNKKNNDNWEILLPLKPELKRFPLHISQVLETLETVEGRSQLEILRDITNIFADVIRLGVNSPLASNGSIPLHSSLEILQGFKNLIFWAARAAINPQLDLTEPVPEAVEYLTKLRLGQTEENSGYIFSILSPLPVDNTTLNGETITFLTTPFERRVVLKLVEALETISALAEGGNLEHFLGSETPLISANLCEAIVGLNESAGGGEIEINLSWSGLISVPPETSDRLVLTPKIMPLLREVAENFRTPWQQRLTTEQSGYN